MNLAISQFKVRVTHFLNGKSYKFNNRRITITYFNERYQFKIDRVDKDPTPYVFDTVNRSIHTLGFSLTQEAAEIVMFHLADALGYDIINKENNKFK